MILIDVLEFDKNDRGVSVVFGEKIVQEFNKKNDLDLIMLLIFMNFLIKDN